MIKGLVSSLVAAVWLVVGAICWPFTADDAYITGRYARHIADGLGYAFDIGQPSDGVTGPLWLIPGAVARLAGADPVQAAKWVGLVCTAVAAFLTVHRALGRAGNTVSWCILLCLLAAQPTPPTWAIGGLETGAATLVLAWLWLAASRRPGPRYWQGGIAAALLGWLRPELAPLGLLMVGWRALRDGRRGWLALLLGLLGLFSLGIWRHLNFGAFLPLSYWAKPPELFHGVEYVVRALLITTGGGGALLAAVATARGRSDDRWLGWLLIAGLAFIALAGGDWMAGFRLFAPLVPLYALLATRGALILWRGSRSARLVALVCLVSAVAVPLADLSTRIGELRRAGMAREQTGKEIATWLQKRAKRVALVDIGYFAYTAGIEVVDLGGLVDPEIARLPGGHLQKRIPLSLMQARAPDAVLLHSSRPPVISDGALLALSGYPVEQRLANSRWLRGSYRAVKTWKYAPGYYYLALTAVPSSPSKQ
jgi:arabinofuranosyltransferase